MKKIGILLIIFLLFVSMPSFHVRADMGPKSSIEIEIIGVDSHYVIDLLYPGILPSQSDIDQMKTDLDNEWIFGGQTIPEVLWTIDDDGFISTSLFRGRPTMLSFEEPDSYRYPYSPPSTVKVIIIFDDSHYLISNEITTKLFTSKLTWDLTNVDLTQTATQAGEIHEDFPVTLMTKDLLLRIFGTIAVEMIVLFAFFYRQMKSYKLALIVNVITQTILTGFLFGMRYFWSPLFGELFVLIVGEFFIIILEMIIYRKYMTEHSKLRAVVYAFIANITSIVANILIMVYLLLS